LTIAPEQVPGAPPNVKTATPTPGPITVTFTLQTEVSKRMVKISVPEAIGLPVPYNLTVFNPVIPKVPVPLKDYPFTVSDLIS
jgi:hypothetical protein